MNSVGISTILRGIYIVQQLSVGRTAVLLMLYPVHLYNNIDFNLIVIRCLHSNSRSGAVPIHAIYYSIGRCGLAVKAQAGDFFINNNSIGRSAEDFV